ncbi:hypothetical protein F5B17DRAFT_424958 [Nemania serpens]|nr:hypothetical protein F5B17DRAFT_424958 [Nemania serpens]
MWRTWACGLFCSFLRSLIIRNGADTYSPNSKPDRGRQVYEKVALGEVPFASSKGPASYFRAGRPRALFSGAAAVPLQGATTFL